MALSNHERVGQAITLLRDGIRPTVERVWRTMYGRQWMQQVNRQLYEPDQSPSADDLAFLLKGIQATWKPVFSKGLHYQTRNYVSLLRKARNDWAHNRKFGSDETIRILDQCEVVLQDFKAPEPADQVRNLKKALQRQVYEQETRDERKRLIGLTDPAKGQPDGQYPPWREVVAPHPDVREGRFTQAEFAADLWQVLHRRAEEEYQDPRAFFARTFLTEGLADLIRIAARRLRGQGGEPVVELQTSFGGGKTHSLIALYHLASNIPAHQLAGVDDLLSHENLTIPRNISRAAFIGQSFPVSDPPPKPDGTPVRTLWGEIAWQLGGPEGYAIVAEDDRNATNPGAKLVELFERFGPALVLIDEWVAYARDLPIRADETRVAGGDFDTQFTFAQALTEAAAAVKNTLVLISIPSSDMEVGGEKGQQALEKLKNVVSRRAAQWRAATTDESFEIVRRRLFEPLPHGSARKRDAVIRAYHDAYRDGPDDFPPAVRETSYRERMKGAYPIHPELFDRLYEDWATLERFQRTRGMLRLMAAVISRLWEHGDTSLMIMPGILPMEAGNVLPEITKYLEDRWDPIIHTDVDGPNSLPLRIDSQARNLGRFSATRRVARTAFLGSAPHAGEQRGIDARRIVLGCAQPGEPPGVFHDALRRLARDATYLYNQDTRFWYDTSPTLTKLARERAADFTDAYTDPDIRRRIQKMGRGSFAGVHVFPDGPGDVPDEDTRVRMVILPPSASHTAKGGADTPAVALAETILTQRHSGPRVNQNLLVFMAADQNRVEELREAVRNRLAWKSIHDDREATRLNLSPAAVEQVKERRADADRTVGMRINETFTHLLTPRKQPGRSEILWHRTPAGGSQALIARAESKLRSDEQVIASYSGIRVKMDIERGSFRLWEKGADHIGIKKLWEYYAQHLYMPRLLDFGVLAHAVSNGVSQLNWEQDTFAFAEAHDEDGDRYLGLKVAEHVGVGDSHRAVIVKAERARRQLDEETGNATGRGRGQPKGNGSDPPDGDDPTSTEETRPTRFYARTRLSRLRAVRDVGQILEEVTRHLEAAGDDVTLTLEIEAKSPGYGESTVRTVGENARQLHFDDFSFEDR